MTPVAYYNEIDPFAAQWLRNLIAAGHIAPGEVDERSIEDVTPDDLRGFTQCHFFAGIGVWSHSSASPDGLTIARSGLAPARASLSARQAKEMGLLTSGTYGPTSSISSASADLSMSLANRLQAVTQTWFDLVQADLEGVGYAFGLVPFTSAGVGAPHIRERAYWVPTPQVNYITNATTVQMSADGRETPNKIGWAASLCGPLRLTVFGEMRTGSYVEMANGVQLNPAHSRWLMGLPHAWDESSPGWQEWQAATASADSKATATP
jgi:site-specific DNA-cytosine methylase